MASLAPVQIGQTNYSISTDANSQTYVVPFIAAMYAAAAGTTNVIQRANVSITAIDETFDLQLSEADSVKLLNAFRVYKSDAGAVDGVLDTSAGVTVDMRDLAAATYFKSALRQAINDALSTHEHLPVDSDAAAAQCSVDAYLKRETYVDTVRQLSYDTLANLLESADLASFTMTLDVSGAAANMYDAMNGEGVNAPRYRRTIFTQLPESNVEAYLTPRPEEDLSGNFNAETVTDINFMPFLSGDKLYFVFDAVIGSASAVNGIIENAPVEGAPITRVVGDADYQDKAQIASADMAGLATLAKNAAEYANGANLTFSAPTKRRIGIAVQVVRDDPEVADPFKLLLTKGEETAVIDPTDADYAYMVAAGLLSDVSGSLELSSAAPSGTHEDKTSALSGSTVAADLSGANFSAGGYVAVDAITGLGAPQASAGVFGAWLVVNPSTNLNQFVLNGSKVEYRARAVTAVNDTASLYYVSNRGKSGPIALSASAAYSNLA